ncbi:two-component system regulatory protein YycI [Sporolactobacillus sp. STCC-11]|uniref:two-component system regulatory protein YycI n=1 Tax=Sporolactobacillus caesalpiniae TaxID=3230362 RepID=UPI003391C75E
MNWSRTKSIFIICFLLLDVFLVFEMYMRQQDENVEPVADGSAITHNYKMETIMPTLPQNVTFLRGTRIDFNYQKDALVQLASGKNDAKKQKVNLEENGRQLTGMLVNPMMLGDVKNEDVQKSLLNMVYQGHEYKFWRLDQGKETIKFAQTYQSRPVYVSTRNKVQMLDFIVQKNQVTGFRQSYLKLSSNKHNKVDLINAEQAINYLADRTDLVGYSMLHIKAIELCYLNTVGVESTEPLIFVPAWHIVARIDSRTNDYFVNAVTGNVQSIN